MQSWIVALIAGTAAFALPWGLAAAKVALDRGFEAGDLAPFGFWSALYGFAMAAISWLLVEITLDMSPRPRYIAGAVVGVLAALLFTVVVAVALGPLMGGF